MTRSTSLINMLPKSVASALAQTTGKIWVGYSGGVDSTVLLHLVADFAVQHDREFAAIHVHHGLQDGADQWLKDCQSFCEARDIPLVWEKVSISQQVIADEGVESAARKARYQVFSRQLNDHDVLVLGHHQQDQAETIFFRMIRGAGVKGLRGMETSRVMTELENVKGVTLIRPLLNHSKDTLVDYAKTHQLTWVEDPTNQDSKMDRNWIRTTLLPQLTERKPGAIPNITRVGQNLQDEYEVLREYYQSLLPDIQMNSVAGLTALNITKLKNLKPNTARGLIRYFAESQGLPSPDRLFLDEIEVQIFSGSEDGQPVISRMDIEARRHREGVYLLTPLSSPPPEDQFMTELNQNLGIVHLELSEAFRESVRSGKVELRFGLPQSTKIQLSNHKMRKSLKQLFQDHDIPAFLRPYWPIVFVDGELTAIPVVGSVEAGFKVELLWVRPLPTGK